MRAVVFDMDGLMFNTEDVYSLVGGELLRRRGHVFSDELKKEMMGLPPEKSFGVMIRRLGLTEDWRTLAAESNAYFLEILAANIQPMPGLMELLDRLERASIPKAIATSSARSLLDACLTQFRLQPRFQFFLTAEDVTHGKPHPEIYLTAASRFGLPSAEILVLEDSQNGCRPRPRPAHSSSPCRPNTAATTISVPPAYKSPIWPTRGCSRHSTSSGIRVRYRVPPGCNRPPASIIIRSFAYYRI